MTNIRTFFIRHYKITVILFVLPSLLILAQNIGYKNLGTIKAKELDEISGIIESRLNPGVLWVHNDSGDKSYIYAIDQQGDLLHTWRLAGAKNRDWEDIAAGPGPDSTRNYLFLGDIGDNDAVYPVRTIYRVPEPARGKNSGGEVTELSGWESISFTYPDGPRDAECLLVDPANGDIYVLSKRDARAHVYVAPYPQPTDRVFEIRLLGTLALQGLTAGDISPDRKFILLKNYNEVFLFRISVGGNIFDALNEEPVRLPYLPEPQGEAIAWDLDDRGYITTGEVVGGIPAQLIHYDFNPEK
jgi:hypothetical protein